MRYFAPLIEGEYYHIYNRGINGENIFKEERNYTYFLNLYAKYIEPVADTFAYCLLKNHFHLLVRIKEVTLTPSGAPSPDGGLKKSPSKQFGHLFNACAQGFNKTYQRTGGLFESPFKRKHVDNDIYFTWLIWYIHANP